MLYESDGDSQEHNQLDNAIVKYFRFGWHIVHGLWKRNKPVMKNTWFQQITDQYTLSSKVIQWWIYSCMNTNYCENEHKFLLSKYLLYK